MSGRGDSGVRVRRRYKSGLVQWAEAQQRKYEAPAVTAAPPNAQPTASCAFDQAGGDAGLQQVA